MAQKQSASGKTAAKAPTAAKVKSKSASKTASARTSSKSASTKTPARKVATAKKTTNKKAVSKPMKAPAKSAAKAKAAPAKAAVSAPKKAVAKKAPVATSVKAPAAASKRVAEKPAAPATASAKRTASPVRNRPVATKNPAVAASGSAKTRSTIKAVAAAVTKPVAKQSTPVDATPAASKPAAEAPKKTSGQRHGFKTNEFIVYPAHGVGQIVAIEDQEIAGLSLELFVITFEKDKMTLRVPTGKFESVGMRKLAEAAVVEKAMTTLKGRARIKRTMWSRRAQEYEAKINSGDLISIAEVVRDLYRSESQPEQSYSERQLYEQALDRMARELAAIEGLDERGSVQRITDVLSKSAKGRRAAEEAAEAAAAEGDVEAA